MWCNILQFVVINLLSSSPRYFMVTRLIMIRDWDISADFDPTWSSSASATICYTGLTWAQPGHLIGGSEECDNYWGGLAWSVLHSYTIIMITGDKLIIVDTRSSPSSSIASLIELRAGYSPSLTLNTLIVPLNVCVVVDLTVVSVWPMLSAPC